MGLNRREEATVCAIIIAIVGGIFGLFLMVINSAWWMIRHIPSSSSSTAFGTGVGFVGSFILLSAREDWKDGISFAEAVKAIMDDY